MVQAINGRTHAPVSDASLAALIHSAVSSGRLTVTIPMVSGLMTIPAPGGKSVTLDVKAGTTARLQGKIVESPQGPRLSDCILQFHPPLVLENLSDLLARPAPAPQKSGGFFSSLKRAATTMAVAASSAVKPPIAGGSIDAQGKIKLDVPMAAFDVGTLLPASFFPTVPMRVADWFKGGSVSSLKPAAPTKLPRPAGAMDAAEAFSKSMQSAVIEAYLASTPKDGKRSELKLNGSLQRTGDVFTGTIAVQGDLDSTVAVPNIGAASILGSGVQAALQGTMTANVEASLGFGGGTIAGSARNVIIDLNIARGSVIGDSVNLALGKETNIAIRAASIAVGAAGVSLDKPSVTANLDLGAGHIKLDDSQLEVESGTLTVGAPSDPAMVADVRYSLLAKANASGKADVDAAIAELRDVFARRVPMVSVSGEAKVDASL